MDKNAFINMLKNILQIVLWVKGIAITEDLSWLNRNFCKCLHGTFFEHIKWCRCIRGKYIILHVVPYISSNFLFMQDNIQLHVATGMLDFFDNNNDRNHLKWPANIFKPDW